MKAVSLPCLPNTRRSGVWSFVVLCVCFSFLIFHRPVYKNQSGLIKINQCAQNKTCNSQHTMRIRNTVLESLVPDSRLREQFFNCPSKKNENYSRPIYITLADECNGRLGNHMFQYAALIGISLQARQRGRCVIPILLNNTRNLELLKIFHLSAILRPTDEPLNNFYSLCEKNAMAYTPSIVDKITPGKNYTIGTYLQSWKYFDHFSSEIREEFRFSKKTLDAASLFLLNKLDRFNEDTVLIGVHVRRGDVTSSLAIERGYKPADKDHLLQSLNYFRQLFAEVVFIVCSDDISWASWYLSNSDVIFSVGNRPEVDLAILSMCSHTVITSGSFGWWAAWLTNGITMYSKQFPIAGTYLDSVCNKSEYYLPEWIGMTY